MGMQQRETGQGREKRRRRRVFSVAMTVFAVMTLLLGGLFVLQRHRGHTADSILSFILLCSMLLMNILMWLFRLLWGKLEQIEEILTKSLKSAESSNVDD